MSAKSIEKQVKNIIEFSNIIAMYENKIKKLQDKLDKIAIYVRILQEGDPENENPQKILDTIENTIEADGN